MMTTENTNTTNTTTNISFKSRGKKNINLRNITTNNNDDDDDDDDEEKEGVVLKAQELKLEQKIRKRKMGIDPMNAIKAHKQHEHDTQVELNKQFKSTNDGTMSLADGIAHEKLMEQYVQDKLGLNNNISNRGVNTKKEDELYRVPDILKSLSSSTKGDDRISDSIGLTSVVEVALPSSYKIRNVKELNEVAIKSQLNKVTNRNRTMQHSRFENHYDSTVDDLDLQAIKKSDKAAPEHNIVSNFAVRDIDKISFQSESSEVTVTSFKSIS